jgi:transcriptional regulator GlxA family with amidase domain
MAVLRTQRRIDEIGRACGFSSTAHFIACYRQVYASTPLTERLAIAQSEQATSSGPTG